MLLALLTVMLEILLISLAKVPMLLTILAAISVTVMLVTWLLAYRLATWETSTPETVKFAEPSARIAFESAWNWV